MKKILGASILPSLAVCAMAFTPVLENQDSNAREYKLKDAFSTKTEILNGNSKISLDAAGSLLTVVATGDTITLQSDEKYILTYGLTIVVN